jgi:ABC-2 type transport system ATP-binding protein
MIEVRNLSKTFTKYEKEKGLKGLLKGFFNAKKIYLEAVKDVSFSIGEGEMVGYIGANGAGKSTTIKMLTGILSPSSGDIKVNGLIPHQNRQKNAQNIGVVFGQRTQLWWDLPLVESFSILKEIYQVSDEDYQTRMNLFDEVLGIQEFIKSPVRTLSLGQRMRADIAASLLHNPKVLYLDEPTIGLDVQAKLNMRQAIKKMNESFKTTVILTTHDMDDIEDLCHRIMILDQGKLIYDGDLQHIKDRYGFMKTVNFTLATGIEDPTTKIEKLIEKGEHIQTTFNEGVLSYTFNKHHVKVQDLMAKVMQSLNVSDVTISDTSVESIVASIYKNKVVT